MSDSADPSRHQQLERQFIGHVERLVTDERLRLATSRGRKSTVTLIRDVAFSDRGVELNRLMSEMGKRDRRLESQMPVGKAMDVGPVEEEMVALQIPGRAIPRRSAYRPRGHCSPGKRRSPCRRPI